MFSKVDVARRVGDRVALFLRRAVLLDAALRWPDTDADAEDTSTTTTTTATTVTSDRGSLTHDASNIAALVCVICLRDIAIH